MVVTNGLMARSLMETPRLSKKTTERATTSDREKAEEKKDEDRPSEDIDYSGAYPCPQEGCIRVFQNLSNLKRHLSVEKCSRSLERLSLLDLAKTEYAAVLQEGVSTMRVVKGGLDHVSREMQNCANCANLNCKTSLNILLRCRGTSSANFTTITTACIYTQRSH